MAWVCIREGTQAESKSRSGGLIGIGALGKVRQKNLEVKNCEAVFRFNPEPVIGHY